MISVKITAGIYSCEVSGEDFQEIRKKSEEFLAEFSELPGFENNCKPSKSRKRVNPVESSENSGEICNPEMLLEWLANQDGHHAKAWIVKHSPYANAGNVLSSLVRVGSIVTAETPYIRSSGNTGYMQGHYLPGDTLPEPWPATDSQVDDKILKTWLEHNQGFTPKFVESNCGIPPRYAQKSLTRLIVANRIHVRKGTDGKGRVHLGAE